MTISDDELFRNGNSYRLHQDTLRWTLVAGYAAFLVGIMGITGLSKKPHELLGIFIVVIGFCYMFILAVENFFYNLFSEYVKDCESRHDGKEELRTLQQFAQDKAKQIGTFHHSFFFAMLIVLLGNFGLIDQLIEEAQTKFYLNAANLVAFLLIFFFWRILVFPYLVSPLQNVFDVALEERNFVCRLFSRLTNRRRKGDGS